jgi:hypothetical protein
MPPHTTTTTDARGSDTRAPHFSETDHEDNAHNHPVIMAAAPAVLTWADRAQETKWGWGAFADSMTRGQSAEHAFAAFAAAQGLDAVPASARDNMAGHFDFVLIQHGKELRVDVKALKRTARDDVHDDLENIWVELHGVRHGQPGWVFGSADVLAFQRPDDRWWLVPRAPLARACMHTIDPCSDALYTTRIQDARIAPGKRIYRRRGFEALILMPCGDVQKLALPSLQACMALS